MASRGRADAVSPDAVPQATRDPILRPTYVAAQLDCSRWLETVRSDIETATGRAMDRARTVRSGWWTIRARDTTGGLTLEAWYDSLTLSRQSRVGELAPDTDGLLGGRYRGVLTPVGEFTPVAHPFVPDEVADVANLADALADLLPPLPPNDLSPGEAWRGPDAVIRRLADSAAGMTAVARYAVEARRDEHRTMPRGDTVPVRIRQIVSEQGAYEWDAAAGLVRRTRDITVETVVPPGGRVRLAVRSRVVQHVELTRLPATACP